ncbi:hypothetical protein L1049_017047 [Liquidambar formosana]|uniref:FAF domain-containing protein n=1 Tax=Liquidambar formosana TaxID=63359 RepID=A0AAP0S0C4_LIQFO
MSTVVCQGFQSCLESQFAEPRTLRLRLASPTPNFSQSLELALKSCMLDSDSKQLRENCHYDDISNSYPADTPIASNPDLGGWSFIQALSNTSKSPQEAMEKEENSYVHPLVKRSSSSLSDKSLELCTENLGSETGTDTVDNSIFSYSVSDSEGGFSPTREQPKSRQLWGDNSIFSYSSSDSEGGFSPTREQPKSRQLWGAKKADSRKFPPPLTTIRGSNSLYVRPHREDGRLVIKAVKVPSTQSCFQAERSNGRLRLCFTENSTSTFDLEVAAAEENEGTNEERGKEEFENEVHEEEEEEEEEERGGGKGRGRG